MLGYGIFYKVDYSSGWTFVRTSFNTKKETKEFFKQLNEYMQAVDWKIVRIEEEGGA
jgi:hypothetical protein